MGSNNLNYGSSIATVYERHDVCAKESPFTPVMVEEELAVIASSRQFGPLAWEYIYMVPDNADAVKYKTTTLHVR